MAVWVTVITPDAGPVSAPFVVLVRLTVAESLSTIVLVAATLPLNVASPEVTLVRVINTVSAPSTIASSSVGIVIVAVVEPAGIVTVPESAVKSLPDAAVPPILYAATVLVALTAVCVTVITPETGPASVPFVVLARLSVALSLSVILIVGGVPVTPV